MVDVTVAVFPATSVAVPVTVAPGPTVLELVGGFVPLAMQLEMPDWESVHVNVIVVVPSGFVVCAAMIDGLDVSTRTVTEPIRVLPSLSVAVEVRVKIPLASSVDDAGVGPEPTPEPASVAAHVTVVVELFQPAALALGDNVADTTGAVLSKVYEAWAVPESPVHLPRRSKLGEAAAVTACMPLPDPAVKVNVHDDLAIDVCRPERSPATSTHLVSDEVVIVSVNAPPFLA